MPKRLVEPRSIQLRTCLGLAAPFSGTPTTAHRRGHSRRQPLAFEANNQGRNSGRSGQPGDYRDRTSSRFGHGSTVSEIGSSVISQQLLIKEMERDDPSVRVLAISALETLKAREALPKLIVEQGDEPTKMSTTSCPGRLLRSETAVRSHL